MENTEVAKVEKKLTASERFTNKVLAEFNSGVGDVALSEYQKRLAQNYFISIDAALKAAEVKRCVKSKKDPLAIGWETVNMETLARNVVTYARIGLDPSQKNHISMMPFKNNALNKYEITFIPGYRGIELTAKKYGLDVPDAVIVELVYTKDKFRSIKKDFKNNYESYEFEIVDDFDRGEIKGGFYYHVYSQAPEKNKLVVFSLKDIEKRKPKYASPEFWGGEKDIWENGKKVGTEHVEGWYEKMCYKTLVRAAYGDITIDSNKIDEDYLRAKANEVETANIEVEAEIAENANGQLIGFDKGAATDVDYTDSEDETPKDTKENPPETAEEGEPY